jgi:hypothetical protein
VGGGAGFHVSDTALQGRLDALGWPGKCWDIFLKEGDAELACGFKEVALGGTLAAMSDDVDVVVIGLGWRGAK